MGMKIDNDNSFLDRHEAHGDRELKYYKDIYGNDVRLMTSKEKTFVNKGLIIASIFIVILVSGFAYKAYLVNKEVEERTRLYLISGQSLADGKEIVEEGGIIKSEDTDVVDVASDGTIVAKTSGTTNVTIYKNIDIHDFSNSKSSKKKDKDEVSLLEAYQELGVEGEITVEVIVEQGVTGVGLNAPRVNLPIGDTFKLNANVFPHTSHNKDVTWTSSNNSVATVDNNGIVTARSEGETTITVTTKDGNFKDSTVVNVIKESSNNYIYLDIKNKDLYVGDTTNANVVVSPDSNLISDVVYSSTDSSVASVDSNGKIVAKKVGKTTITARIASEGIFASKEIVVSEKKIEKIYLSSEHLSLHVNDKVVLQTYLYPNDATSFMSYSSNDNNVVSVNSRGEVVALKEGVATITVKGNNNVFAQCIVEVKNSIVKTGAISVSLERSNIDVGETTKLTANVKPENATNKKITYVSSDYSVARVDNHGNIYGVSPGTAVITATSSNGSSNSVSIKVNNTDIKVTKITLEQNVKLSTGKSTSIEYDIYPDNASNKDIIWTSSDSGIVKVDNNGIVTGIKDGTAIVTAKIGDVSVDTVVTVKGIDVTKVILNTSDLTLIVGETFTLESYVEPALATNGSLTWTSSNAKVASVDKDGKIYAVKEGTAVIKATSVSNPKVYVECNVTVSKIGVESFKLNKGQVLVTQGNTVKISVSNINPSNATYPNVSYMVNDTSIASVNSKGVVTGLKPGKTTLTVTVDDATKVIDLTVFEKGDKVYFIDTYTDEGIPSDAILLESNGKFAMIDTGSQTSSIKVIDFLHDLGVKRLEFILITHFHSESFGGIYGEIDTDNLLLSDIKIGKVYMKEYTASDSYFKDKNGNVLNSSSQISDRRKLRSTMYTNIRENAILEDIPFSTINSSLDSLRLGNFDLELFNTTDNLKPYSGKCLKNRNCNENSNSIVTYAKVNGKSMYLSGDIYNAKNSDSTKYLKTKTEESVAKEITKLHGKKVDIYKASNYGNEDNNVKEALQLLNPKYSIVTNSKSSFNDNNNMGVNRVIKYTSDDVYYSGDGTVVVNVNSKGNISFTQLND